MRNLRDTFFYMKTNVLQNFHICISLPLTLSVPGYFCLIMPRGSVNPDRKILLTWNLAQSYFVMLQKKMEEKHFQNSSYRDDDITNYANFFEKLCEKWLKYVFFSKINLVAARKKIFKIFFQLLKVKITYKLNIYRLIC